MPSSTIIQSKQLIVDFPSSRRSGNIGQSSSKKVRFASHCEGRYIDYPSEKEISKGWYSAADFAKFKQRIARDAVKCSMVVLSIRQGRYNDLDPTDFFLTHCVGLDHLISRDVAKRYEAVKEARKEHSRTVLEEQERLRFLNVDSIENLARVSEASSNISRKRARRIGRLLGTSTV
jgi:hypothetical protein